MTSFLATPITLLRLILLRQRRLSRNNLFSFESLINPRKAERSMKIKFKKINPLAYTPTKAHKEDAGYDLYAYTQQVIKPGQTVKVTTGIILEVPEGYYMQIVPRSGLSSKTALRIPNSPGTVDSGYRGEIIVLLQNIATDPFEIYTVNRGDRIAQMILRKCYDYDLEETDCVSETDRGSNGFGSSGK